MKIISFGISLLLTFTVMPFIKAMLFNANIIRKNYKGDQIPVSMGIGFVPIVIINSIVVAFIYSDHRTKELVLIFLTGIMTMATVGLIDDLVGNREATGFKGHIMSLLRGKLTTGGFKAIVGGLISLFIGSMLSFNVFEIVLNTLIIALFTNLINLLDLRPGRALKGFLLISFIFMGIGILEEIKVIVLSSVAYAIGYFYEDMKGNTMMGDVGSNTLGVVLGISSAISFTLPIKCIILVLLIGIHLVAEKYSITEIIKKNPILNFIDKLGC